MSLNQNSTPSRISVISDYKPLPNGVQSQAIGPFMINPEGVTFPNDSGIKQPLDLNAMFNSQNEFIRNANHFQKQADWGNIAFSPNGYEGAAAPAITSADLTFQSYFANNGPDKELERILNAPSDYEIKELTPNQYEFLSSGGNISEEASKLFSDEEFLKKFSEETLTKYGSEIDEALLGMEQRSIVDQMIYGELTERQLVPEIDEKVVEFFGTGLERVLKSNEYVYGSSKEKKALLLNYAISPQNETKVDPRGLITTLIDRGYVYPRLDLIVSKAKASEVLARADQLESGVAIADRLKLVNEENGTSFTIEDIQNVQEARSPGSTSSAFTGLPEGMTQDMAAEIFNDPISSIVRDLSTKILDMDIEKESSVMGALWEGVKAGDTDYLPFIGTFVSIAEQQVIDETLSKVRDGKPLTTQEEMLADLVGIENVLSSFGDQRVAYLAGSSLLPETLSFAVDLAATGGISASLRKGLLRTFAGLGVKGTGVWSTRAVNGFANLATNMTRTGIIRSDNAMLDVMQRLSPANAYFFDGAHSQYISEIDSMANGSGFNLFMEAYLVQSMELMTEQLGTVIDKSGIIGKFFKSGSKFTNTELGIIGRAMGMSSGAAKRLYEAINVPGDYLKNLFYSDLVEAGNREFIPKAGRFNRNKAGRIINGIGEATESLVRGGHISNIYLEFFEEFIAQRLEPVIRADWSIGVKEGRPVIDVKGFDDKFYTDPIGTLKEEAILTAWGVGPITGLSTVANLPSQIVSGIYGFTNAKERRNFKLSADAINLADDQELADGVDAIRADIVKNVRETKNRQLLEDLLQARLQFESSSEKQTFKTWQEHRRAAAGDNKSIRLRIKSIHDNRKEGLKNAQVVTVSTEEGRRRLRDVDAVADAFFNQTESTSFIGYYRKKSRESMELQMELTEIISTPHRAVNMDLIEQKIAALPLSNDTKKSLRKLAAVAKLERAKVRDKFIVTTEVPKQIDQVGKYKLREEPSGLFIEDFDPSIDSDSFFDSLVGSLATLTSEELAWLGKSFNSLSYVKDGANTEVPKAVRAKLGDAVAKEAESRLERESIVTDMNLKNILQAVEVLDGLHANNFVSGKVKRRLQEKLVDLVVSSTRAHTNPDLVKKMLFNLAPYDSVVGLEALERRFANLHKVPKTKKKTNTVEVEVASEETVLAKLIRKLNIKGSSSYSDLAETNQGLSDLDTNLKRLAKSDKLGPKSERRKLISLIKGSILQIPEAYLDFNIRFVSGSNSSYDASTNTITIGEDVSPKDLLFNITEEIMHSVHRNIAIKVLGINPNNASDVAKAMRLTDASIEQIAGDKRGNVISAVANFWKDTNFDLDYFYSILGKKMSGDKTLAQSDLDFINEVEKAFQQISKLPPETKNRISHGQGIDLADFVKNYRRYAYFLKQDGMNPELAYYYASDFAEFFARNVADLLIDVQRSSTLLPPTSRYMEIANNVKDYILKTTFAPIFSRFIRSSVTEDSIADNLEIFSDLIGRNLSEEEAGNLINIYRELTKPDLEEAKDFRFTFDGETIDLELTFGSGLNREGLYANVARHHAGLRSQVFGVPFSEPINTRDIFGNISEDTYLRALHLSKFPQLRLGDFEGNMQTALSSFEDRLAERGYTGELREMIPLAIDRESDWSLDLLEGYDVDSMSHMLDYISTVVPLTSAASIAKKFESYNSESSFGFLRNNIGEVVPSEALQAISNRTGFVFSGNYNMGASLVAEGFLMGDNGEISANLYIALNNHLAPKEAFKSVPVSYFDTGYGLSAMSVYITPLTSEPMFNVSEVEHYRAEGSLNYSGARFDESSIVSDLGAVPSTSRNTYTEIFEVDSNPLKGVTDLIAPDAAAAVLPLREQGYTSLVLSDYLSGSYQTFDLTKEDAVFGSGKNSDLPQEKLEEETRFNLASWGKILRESQNEITPEHFLQAMSLVSRESIANKETVMRSMLDTWKKYYIKRNAGKFAIFGKRDLNTIIKSDSIDNIIETYLDEVKMMESIVRDSAFRNLMAQIPQARVAARRRAVARASEDPTFFNALRKLSLVHPKALKSTDIPKYLEMLRLRPDNTKDIDEYVKQVNQWHSDWVSKKKEPKDKTEAEESASRATAEVVRQNLAEYAKLLALNIGTAYSSNQDIADYVSIEVDSLDLPSVRRYIAGLRYITRHGRMNHTTHLFAQKVIANSFMENFMNVAEEKHIEWFNKKAARKRVLDTFLDPVTGNIKYFSLKEHLNFLDGMTSEYSGILVEGLFKPLERNQAAIQKAMLEIQRRMAPPKTLASNSQQHILGIVGLLTQKPDFTINKKMLDLLVAEGEGGNLRIGSVLRHGDAGYDVIARSVREDLGDSIVSSFLEVPKSLNLTGAKRKRYIVKQKSALFVGAKRTAVEVSRTRKKILKETGFESIAEFVEHVIENQENTLNAQQKSYLAKARKVMKDLADGEFTEGRSLEYTALVHSGDPFVHINDYVPIRRYNETEETMQRVDELPDKAGEDPYLKNRLHYLIHTDLHINNRFVESRKNVIMALDTSLYSMIRSRADQQLFYILNQKHNNFLKAAFNHSFWKPSSEEQSLNSQANSLIKQQFSIIMNRGFRPSQVALRQKTATRVLSEVMDSVKIWQVSHLTKAPAQFASSILSMQAMDGNLGERAGDWLWANAQILGAGTKSLLGQKSSMEEINTFLLEYMPDVYFRGISDFDLDRTPSEIIKDSGSLKSYLKGSFGALVFKNNNYRQDRNLAQQLQMTPLLISDRLAAKVAALALYRNYSRSAGLDVDLLHPDRYIAEKAQQSTNETQASDNPLHRPAVLNNIVMNKRDFTELQFDSALGELWNRSNFAFKSFALSEYKRLMKARQKMATGVLEADASMIHDGALEYLISFVAKMSFQYAKILGSTYLFASLIRAGNGDDLEDIVGYRDDVMLNSTRAFMEWFGIGALTQQLVAFAGRQMLSPYLEKMKLPGEPNRMFNVGEYDLFGYIEDQAEHNLWLWRDFINDKTEAGTQPTEESTTALLLLSAPSLLIPLLKGRTPFLPALNDLASMINLAKSNVEDRTKDKR